MPGTTGDLRESGHMAAVETAVARHDRMVREERDQAERVRTDQAGRDIWKGNARRFQPVEETIEPAVSPLAELAGPDARVIDVGAGGGRIAIPLARRVREVVAVEPSAAMREVLAEATARSGVRNVTVVPDRWEDAEVAPAELAFAAHVTYGVQAIEPFVRKLDRLATRHAALVAFAEPPQHFVAPFWRVVYGEERLRLPCREELLAVVRELGGEPASIDLPPQAPRSLGAPEEAFRDLRRRLYIGEGTTHEAALRDAIDSLTVEQDGELWPRDARPNPVSIIWWEAGHMA
jgi:2-polyprenyl-3-methyl-5-hydroxy-6-metoxy-1,4-benzoquinol methylase